MDRQGNLSFLRKHELKEVMKLPQVLRHGKHVLPTIARLCLISTFLEDGFRMWVHWSEQREYIDISWGCGKFLATIFVLVNFIGQIGGCVMLIGRFQVPFTCGVLFFIMVLQTSDVSEEILKLQNKIAELEEDKGNLQLHLVDFDELKVSESHWKARISELEEGISQQNQDLDTHVHMIALLEAEKLNFIKEIQEGREKEISLKKEIKELKSSTQLENLKLTLEMKTVDLEEEQIDIINKEIKELQEELEAKSHFNNTEEKHVYEENSEKQHIADVGTSSHGIVFETEQEEGNELEKSGFAIGNETLNRLDFEVELENSRKLIEEQKTIIMDLNLKIDSRDEELDLQREIIMKLEQLNSEEEKEDKITSIIKELNEMANDLEEWKKRCTEVETRLQDLGIQKDELEVRFNEVKTENSILKQRLEDKHELAADLTAKLKDISNAITSRDEKITVLQSMIELNSQNLEAREMTLKDVHEKLNTVEKQFENKLSELKSFHIKEKEIMEMATSLTKRDDLLNERDKLIKELNDILQKERQEFESLRQLVSNAENSARQLQDQLADLSKTTTEKQNLILELTATKEKLVEELTDKQKLDEEIQDHRKVVDGLTKELHEEQTRTELISEELTRVTEKKVTLERDLKYSESKVQEIFTLEENQVIMSNKITELETEISQFQRELKSRDEAVNRLKEENSRLNDHEKEVTSILEEDRVKHAELITSLEEKITILEADLTARKNELDEFRNVINDKELRIDQLNEQMMEILERGSQSLSANETKLQEREAVVEFREQGVSKSKERIQHLEERLAFVEERRLSVEKKAEALGLRAQESHRMKEEAIETEGMLEKQFETKSKLEEVIKTRETQISDMNSVLNLSNVELEELRLQHTEDKCNIEMLDKELERLREEIMNKDNYIQELQITKASSHFPDEIDLLRDEYESQLSNLQQQKEIIYKELLQMKAEQEVSDIVHVAEDHLQRITATSEGMDFKDNPKEICNIPTKYIGYEHTVSVDCAGERSEVIIQLENKITSLQEELQLVKSKRDEALLRLNQLTTNPLESMPSEVQTSISKSEDGRNQMLDSTISLQQVPPSRTQNWEMNEEKGRWGSDEARLEEHIQKQQHTLSFSEPADVLNKGVTELENHIKDLKDQRDKLSEKLHNSQVRCGKMLMKMKELKLKNDILLKENRDVLNKRVTELENHIKDLKDQRDKLSEKLHNSQVRCGKMLMKMKELKLKNDILLKENRDVLNKGVTELENHIKDLKDQRDKLSEKLHNSQVRCGKMLKKMKELKLKNDILLKENRELTKKKSEYVLSNLDQAIEEEHAELITSLEEKITILEADLTARKNELDEFRNVINDKELRIDQLNEQMMEILERGSQSLSANETKLQEREAVVEFREQEVSKSKERIQHLEERLAFVEERRLSVEKKAEALGLRAQESHRMKEEAIETEGMLEKQFETKSKLEEVIKTRETQISDMNSVLNLSNVELEELRLQHTEDKCNIEMLDKELERLREEIMNKDNYIQELQITKASSHFPDEIDLLRDEYESQLSNLQQQKEIIYKELLQMKAEQEVSDIVHVAEDHLQRITATSEGMDFKDNPKEICNIPTKYIGYEHTVSVDCAGERSEVIIQLENKITSLQEELQLVKSKRDEALLRLNQLTTNPLESMPSEVQTSISKSEDGRNQMLDSTISLQQVPPSRTQNWEMNEEKGRWGSDEARLEEHIQKQQHTLSFSEPADVLNKGVTELENHIKDLKDQRDKLSEKLHNSQVRCGKMLMKMKELKLKNDILLKENRDVLNKRVTELENHIKDLKDQRDKLSEKLHNSQVRCGKMLMKMKELKLKNDILLKENRDVLNKGVTELENHIKDLKDQRDKLSEKLHNSQVRCGKMLKKMKELKLKNDILLKENRELTKKKSEYVLSNLDQAIEEELKIQIDTLEKEVKVLTSERDSIRAEKDGLLKRIDILASANEKLVESKEIQAEVEEDLQSLANKLSELRRVGYHRDVTLQDKRQQRHSEQVRLLHQRSSGIVVDTSYTLSRDVQSPSTVLFNWIWGRRPEQNIFCKELKAS